MEADPQLRDAALRMAERIADKAFEGRKGHGNSKSVVHRQMKREELVVYLAAAFERGAEFGSKR